MGQRRVHHLHAALGGGRVRGPYELAPTIGSSDFADTERVVAFVDEELTFTTNELYPGDISFMDAAEIDEAMVEDDEF